MHPFFGPCPRTRMRRNRKDDWSRRLVREHELTVDELIWPCYVQEGSSARSEIASMPGVARLSTDLLIEAAREAADLGIPAMAVFPVTDPKDKSPDGTEATNPDNLVCRAVRAIREAKLDIGIVC